MFVMGCIISPRKMLPDATTCMCMREIAFTFSSMVQSLAHKLVGERVSGKTVLLHLVMPATRASTLEVAQGDALWPMLWRVRVREPMMEDSRTEREVHVLKSAKGTLSDDCARVEGQKHRAESKNKAGVFISKRLRDA